MTVPQSARFSARKCFATGRLVGSKDHAAVQINVAEVNAAGIITGKNKTVVVSGFVRQNAESDDSVNRFATESGLLKSVWSAQKLIRDRFDRLMDPSSNNDSPQHGLDSEQLAELREAFAMFDKDGDGTITLIELASVMRALGQQPTDDELQIMMNSVDLDQNGVIDFDEFLILMKNHFYTDENAPSLDAEFLEAFRVFDRNGDGFITEEELKQALLNLGERLTGGEIRDMIAAADKDGNGLIDYNEFVGMMQNK